MIAEPGGQGGLIQVATRQSAKGRYDFFFANIDAEAIQAEEEVHGLKGHALVSVEERMVTCDTESAGCSECREVGIGLVAESVARAPESGLEQATVTHADSASMGLDLIGMDGEDVDRCEPPGLAHLASSRMALR